MHQQQTKRESMNSSKYSEAIKIMNRDKPKIRFKGFEEAWSKKTLGEVCKLNGRIGFRGYTEEDIITREEGGILTFSPSNIVNNQLKTNGRNTYITKYKFDESPEIQVHNGDILFVKTGSTLGKSALVNKIYEDATVNPQIVVLKCKNYLQSIIASILTTNNILNQVNQAKIGGAIPTLTETKIKTFHFHIPNSHSESKMIGLLYSQLDHLLNLQQRKCDKLKDIKKSMLTKMFPKPGKKVPEVRFEGFTDDWVECFVKDVCNIATGLSNTQDQTENGIYPFFIRSDKPLKSNKYLYDCEAVITIGDGNIGKVFHYINGKFDLHQRCYKMTDFRYVIGKYFFYYFSTHFYERVMKMSAKATVDSVRLEMISDMKLLYPVDIKEQKLIAYFFHKLDSLIRLSELKLSKLRLLKRSLLEGMFV